MKGSKMLRLVSVSLAFMALLAMALPAAGAEVTQEWVARYNGPHNYWDKATAIATAEVEVEGEKVLYVYVTGQSHGGGGTTYDYATAAYNAETGNQVWVARHDGPGNGTDMATAIATYTDADGNVTVYVTGWDLNLFGGSYAHNDYATVAYDGATGTQLWIARYNGPKKTNSDDRANAIAVDPATGYVYVTGYSEGTLGYWDYATIAYNADGNQQWVARYEGNYSDMAYAIAVDSETGDVYVTGEGVGNYLTVAYNSSGTQQWAAAYNGPGNWYDKARAIATVKVGNDTYVYVTGNISGFDYGTDDYATVAYDADTGNQQWVAIYNGPGNYVDRATAIATGKKGNDTYVYVTGHSSGIYGAGEKRDIATIAYDAETGDESWVARYNGPGNPGDKANAMAVDNQGNVYVTGESNYNYATVAYDSDGTQQWVHLYNGPGNYWDTASAITTHGGDVYVTGSSTESGTNNWDYATIKLSQ